MREKRSAQIKYYAPPAHAAKVMAIAEERKCSVSNVIHGFLLDHLREKLKAETNQDRIDAIKRAIDSSVGRRDRPLKPRVYDYTPGGFVYLVKCGKFYKIGRAKNLKLRMAGLQFSEKPRLIKAVRCIGYGFLERALHALFSEKRTHGEWFALSPENLLQAKQYMEARSKS